MANNRLEELRQRAHERIQQVREAMERGEDVSSPGTMPPPPDEGHWEPAPTPYYDPAPAQTSAEGQSLEGPSLEVIRRQPEPPSPQREQPPAQHTIGPSVRHRGRGHRSVAARVLNRETLRQAILAQEILGKPVSLRQPRETEDL